jgi:diguanylate cyclase (GGDEF)-like protein
MAWLSSEVSSAVAGSLTGIVPRTPGFRRRLDFRFKIRWENLLVYFFPDRLSSQSRRQRNLLIISRVRFVSLFFGFAVPAWIVIDWWILPDHWDQLAVLRLLSAAIFLALVLASYSMESTRFARTALATMLAIPPAVYLLAIPVMQGIPDAGLQGVLKDLYGYLPYIVMGGLCMFPLTIVELLALSVPIVVVMMYGNSFLAPGDWEQQISTLWLLLVIMGISAFSAISQLQFLRTLVRRASLDPLTGVYTRQTGMETLELQYRFAEIHDRSFAVAFIDLDDFKSINDEFGHDEGDEILSSFARRLEAVLRRGDVLIRWGGEEFVVILNDSDEVGTRGVIDRILEKGFGRRPDNTPVTASIGVAERVRDGSEGWTDLVALADSRMYEAKRRGKNCVVYSDDAEPIGPLVLAIA